MFTQRFDLGKQSTTLAHTQIMTTKIYGRLRQIDPGVAGHLWLHIDAECIEFPQNGTQIGFGLQIVRLPHLFGATDRFNKADTWFVDDLFECWTQQTFHVIQQIQTDFAQLGARLPYTVHTFGHRLQLWPSIQIVFYQLRCKILQFVITPNDQCCDTTNPKKGRKIGQLLVADWDGNLNWIRTTHTRRL